MSMLLRRYHEKPERDSVLNRAELNVQAEPEDTDSLLAKNPEHPVEAQEPVGTTRFEKPAGNASREEWVEYAAAQGLHETALVDMSRNEIRDQLDK